MVNYTLMKLNISLIFFEVHYMCITIMHTSFSQGIPLIYIYIYIPVCHVNRIIASLRCTSLYILQMCVHKLIHTLDVNGYSLARMQCVLHLLLESHFEPF